MNRSGVYNYDSAARWLMGARRKDKTTRTLYEWGLTLRRMGPNQISIMYGNPRGTHHAQIISYFSDGSIVIHNTAPMYQSVRRIISEYLDGVKVVYRKYKLVVSTEKDGVTPSKVRRCRVCKGKKQFPRTCWGPRDCYQDSCEIYQEYRQASMQLRYCNTSDESEVLYAKMRSLIHAHDTCSHGNSTKHLDYTNLYDCFRCSGTGFVEYGQKRRGRIWDKKIPFFITKDGDVIEDLPTILSIVTSVVGGEQCS